MTKNRHKKVQEAEFKARKLLLDYDLDNIPVDLYKLLRLYNITIAWNEFDKFGALLYKKKNKLLMIVNKRNPPEQRRFHMAHEIGHYVLDHQGTFFQSIALANTESNCKSIEEQCADAFASELLIPSCRLRRIAFKNHFNVKKLKRLFSVSEYAMAYKLYLLDLPYKNTFYEFNKNFYS